MTSLIERLRSWSMADCQEAATALEQARDLLKNASWSGCGGTDASDWANKFDAWLRLIDGEQEKEG